MTIAATPVSCGHRLVRGLLLTVLAGALLAAAPASAQVPSPTKTPTGPWVVQNPTTGVWQVNAGETITWEITVLNPSGSGTVVSLVDTPQHVECEPGGRSDWGQTGNAQESAPQTGLYLADLDGDGSCAEAAVAVPPGAVFNCDVARQRVEVTNIDIPARGSAVVKFKTEVDAGLPPGVRVCNWAHVLDARGMLLQDTQDPNGMVPGCTCLDILPPNMLDFDVEKSVALDNPPPLIPNDPASTVVYTVTLRNTGGEDIVGGTYTDNLTMAPNTGLEWVEIVDCPGSLRCTLTPPNMLSVSGWNLPAGMDPPAEQSVQVRAKVVCSAATDDDTGQICNQGRYSYNMLTFVTDDPTQIGTEDPTCTPVAFSNLTESTKFIESFDDTNGNGQLDVGERVHFVVRATNTGRLTSRGVVVSDDLSASTCFDPASIQALDGGVVAGGVITWNVGTLMANPSLPPTVDLHFSVVLSASVPSCCNQAFLQSDERTDCMLTDRIPTDNPSTPMPADPTCAAPGPQPQLTATKVWSQTGGQDANTNGRPDVGELVTWTVTITNTGAGAATAAEFIDPMPVCLRDFDGSPTVTTSAADGDWGDNSSVPYAGAATPGRVDITRLGGDDGIQPGETITITFVARVQGFTAGCCNQGRVEYAESAVPKLTDDPATVGQPNDDSCLEPAPDESAELEKTRVTVDNNGDGFFCTGETVRYTMHFRNTGNVDLHDVVIDDPSSACIAMNTGSVVITPAGSATDTSSATDVQIQIASIAPAAEVTITFDATTLVEGTCDNQATYVATELPLGGRSDANTSNAAPEEPTRHVVTCPPVADIQLTLAKDASPTGCLDPGTTVTFTLTVTNTGADPVSTFSVLDTLPGRLTNVVATAPLVYDAGAGTVRVDDGGALASGADVTYTYTADVPCTLQGSDVNDAELTYNDGSGDRTVTDSVTVSWGSPDLSTTSKTMNFTDTNGNGYVDGTEVVTYDVSVCNDAGAGCDARDVLVTDQLDARFDLASVVVNNGGTLVGDTITWDMTGTPALGAIAPGTCVALSFDVQVDGATAMPAAIPNTVTAEALGNSNAACAPGTLPDLVQSVDAQRDVPWGEQPGTGQVDLLRNAAVTSRETALSEVRTSVFDMSFANTTTCGTTRLAVPRDVAQADVGTTIGAGLTVAGDGAVGGSPVVFYEASELCDPTEGGTDERLCVRKVGNDVLVATSPNPDNCP